MILGKKLYSKSNRILNVFRVMTKIVPTFWKVTFGRTREGLYSIPSKGAPALTVKEDGTLRCTTCRLCEKICPSFCITMVSQEHEPEEAPPLSFDINILKCTFCSLCEDVCPVDAIRMEGPMPSGGHSEQNWVWDKEYLKTYAGELKSTVGDDRPLLP